MMSQRQVDLMDRKQQLLVRSAELRMTLATQTQVLQAPLAILDQIKAAILWLGKHPVWPLATLALIAVVRPRRSLRLVSRFWWGWGMYRQVQQWIGRLSRQ